MLCNFVVDNFFVWNHLSNKTYIWILTFEIWFFQTTLDGETTKTKVVDLKMLCNFIVDNFFIGNLLSKENIMAEFPHNSNSFFFQLTSDREMSKTKDVDLEKL
jgi:hypothetical protein